MAHFRPDRFTERIGQGLVDYGSDDLRVYAFGGTISPTPDQSTLETMQEIVDAGGVLLDVTAQLLNVTNAGGVIAAANVTGGNFSGTVVAVAVGIYTGALPTTPVAYYLDDATELPQPFSNQPETTVWNAAGLDVVGG